MAPEHQLVHRPDVDLPLRHGRAGGAQRRVQPVFRRAAPVQPGTAHDGLLLRRVHGRARRDPRGAALGRWAASVARGGVVVEPRRGQPRQAQDQRAHESTHHERRGRAPDATLRSVRPGLVPVRRVRVNEPHHARPVLVQVVVLVRVVVRPRPGPSSPVQVLVPVQVVVPVQVCVLDRILALDPGDRLVGGPVLGVLAPGLLVGARACPLGVLHRSTSRPDRKVGGSHELTQVR